MPNPQYNTDGGYRSATIYSGIIAGPSLAAAPGAVAVGSDVMLYSGNGRLNQILPFNLTTSGIGVLFYDAAAPVSGGPIVASGHKVVGFLPATSFFLVSGVTSTLTAGTPIQVDMPFNSGLCCSTRSGAPSFTVSYTAEPAGGERAG